jgi:tRNA pseudouridine13 synthase
MNRNLDLTINKDLEEFVGISVYNTSTVPLGGFIKSIYSDFIVGEITPDGIALTVDPNDPQYPEDSEFGGKKKYTHFTLIKQNEDTIAAAQLIANALGISFHDITWAGLKDNNAITAQRMSIRGDYGKALKDLSFNNLKIKDIVYCKHPLVVGDLSGNYFKIIIRNIGYDEKMNPILNPENSNDTFISNIVQETKNQINKYGFPNFYGLQRFGSHRPNSHRLGKLIFKKQYHDVVNEFITNSFPKESEEIKNVREKIRLTQNYKEGLEIFPKNMGYERTILHHLVECPEDYLSAIKRLPYPLVKLIMSAYQSFLFNKAISLRKLKGDPLHQPKPRDKITLLDSPRGSITLLSYHYGNWYDEFINRALELDRATILCPILGKDTHLSNQYFDSIYSEILKEENFTLNEFKNSIIQDFEYAGTDRAITVKPKDFSAEYIVPKNKKAEKHIKLEFSLPKGSYATMLIREFTKI